MAERKVKKKSSKSSAKNTLVIELVRSVIGTTKRQREIVKGLGLRRVRHTVERQNTPEVRGMVVKVAHLLKVVER